MTAEKKTLAIVAEPTEDSQHSGCGPVSLNVLQNEAGVPAVRFQGRAAIITLGCAKNQVDSEVMAGVLVNSGFEIVADLDRADIAVVNTCSFLQSAIDESHAAIEKVTKLKRRGQLRTVIVAGCLVSRHRESLVKQMPAVDAFLSTEEITNIGSAALGETLQSAARPYFLYDETKPRLLASARHTAYIKVSEGCNRPCAFCIIPKIRGPLRSRSIDSVVAEAKALARQGVQEINLVAQDLTSFGDDYGRRALPELLRRLDGESGVPWIRLLYAYPVGVDTELLQTIERLPTVCNYIDIPLQHVADRVLQAMRRPRGRYGTRDITTFIRDTAPILDIRTTFIVGFPGESAAEADELATFVSEGHFSSVGVFTYSREADTAAYDLPDQISSKEKKRRREAVMAAQQAVSAARNHARTGQSFEALLEGIHPESDDLLVARTRFQAPEVDGVVIVNRVDGAFSPGMLGTVECTDALDYDLVGTFRANPQMEAA